MESKSMYLNLKHRTILKFRQKRWPGILVGIAFFALLLAIQIEMVRILPPAP